MSNDNDKPRRPVLSVRAAEGPKKRQAARRAAEENLSSVAVDMLAPTEASIRDVITRIEDVFNALGTDDLPGTIIPAGAKNNAKEAADYVLADKLVKLANDRLKNALEAAEKAGVFGDPTEYREGDTVMVFSDPNFSINVKMGRPSVLINREKVEAAASEFLGKRASEFMEQCKKPRAATKTIIVSMK